MLKNCSLLLCLLMLTACLPFEYAHAQPYQCTAETAVGARYDVTVINAGVSCRSTSTDSRDETRMNNVGGSTSSGSTGCSRSDGAEVACWYGEYWWSPTYDKYCKVANFPDNSPLWDGYRDPQGRPIGTYYLCRTFWQESTTDAPYWENTTPVTPPKPGTDPITLVRETVDSLGLHAPTVGVGAYVYPGYEQWGLSWWVGAPMWLWVDATDSLQWGTHSLSASEWDLSVSATVTATSVVFDPGDGIDPVSCTTAGTPRPWDPKDKISHHSPSGCEYIYQTTNELGNIDSRYNVTATVTWTVEWSSTDGQYGDFTTHTTSTTPASIHVGELRVVRVPPPGD